MFELSEDQEERVQRLHKKCVIFDAHCDTILSIIDGERKLGEKSDKGHIDIPRLKSGGIGIQVFAVFVRPDWYHDAVHMTMRGISIFIKEIKENNKDILLIKPGEDFYSGIQKARQDGKISALISIEGGEALQGDIDMLRIYKELGVSSIVLTWNHRNAIADGAQDLRSGGGLSDFGVEVIKEMERLGMVVDLAHISPKGFWDVMDVATKPIIVSHSLPRKFMDIPRNLDDEQIKAVAQKGGVIGTTFYFTSYGGKQGSVENILDAIDYFVNIAGIDHVGIGSDFDGYDGTVLGLESCEKVINLTRGLVHRGYSDEDIEKILGGNFVKLYGTCKA